MQQRRIYYYSTLFIGIGLDHALSSGGLEDTKETGSNNIAGIYLHMTSQLLPRAQRVLYVAWMASAAASATTI